MASRSACIVITLLGAVWFQSTVHSMSVGEFVSGTDDKTSNFITPQQKYLTNQFRNQNAFVLKDDYMKSDAFIVGWLRANKWTFQRAAALIRRGNSWRAVNKVEELGKAELSPDMDVLFPFRLDAKDEQGCPVLEVDFGQWDVTDHMHSAIMLRDAQESFAKHGVQMWEKARMGALDSVKQCAQVVWLQDMQDFSTKHLSDPASKAAIIKIMTNLETYYPNLIKEAHFINANDETKEFFTMIKPYLSQSTLNVMNVYTEADQSWQDHVLLSIDPEQLPPRYGGVKGLF